MNYKPLKNFISCPWSYMYLVLAISQNLAIIHRACGCPLSAFALGVLYTPDGTDRITTLQPGISFCLQVLSTGSNRMMVLHFFSCPRIIFFYLIIALCLYTEQAKPRRGIVYSWGINLYLWTCKSSSS